MEKRDRMQPMVQMLAAGVGVCDEEITTLDKEKAKYLLKRVYVMKNAVQDYEDSLKIIQNGMSALDSTTATSKLSKFEHNQEDHADITANAVVLMEKRKKIYGLYKTLVQLIESIINNISNPHEAKIAEMIFLNGKSYMEVERYMGMGYTKELYPISATTVCAKRRETIVRVSYNLKMMGILDFIQVDEKAKGGFRINLPGYN